MQAMVDLTIFLIGYLISQMTFSTLLAQPDAGPMTPCSIALAKTQLQKTNISGTGAYQLGNTSSCTITEVMQR